MRTLLTDAASSCWVALQLGYGWSLDAYSRLGRSRSRGRSGKQAASAGRWWLLTHSLVPQEELSLPFSHTHHYPFQQRKAENCLLCCAARTAATTASSHTAHHGGSSTHRDYSGDNCPAPESPRSEKLQHHISASSGTAAAAAAATPTGPSSYTRKAAAAAAGVEHVVHVRGRQWSSASGTELVDGDGSQARHPHRSRCACAPLML